MEWPARVTEVKFIVDVEDCTVDGPVVGESAEGPFKVEFRGRFNGIRRGMWTSEDVYSMRGVPLRRVCGAKVHPPVIVYDVQFRSPDI